MASTAAAITSEIGRRDEQEERRQDHVESTQDEVARPLRRVERKLAITADERVLDPRRVRHALDRKAASGRRGVGYKLFLWTRSSLRPFVRLSSAAASRRPPTSSGVTQPAVSLQIRSLEQRVGQRLLDRSGRRVEPTEAGLRLYRGAQRLLALEQQLLADLGEEAEGELKGRLEIGASTGPGRDACCRSCSGSSSSLHPLVHGRADGVGHAEGRRAGRAARARARDRRSGRSPPRRRRSSPSIRDEVVLAVPVGHRRADKSMTLDELKAEPLFSCRKGAGIRQMIDDELRELGLRLRDLEREARARAAGVGARRGARRLRRHVHLADRDRGRPRGRRRSRSRASRVSSRRATSSSPARAAAPRRAWRRSSSRSRVERLA